MKYFFITFSILFFVYMILPGPGKISDFNALPVSDKSKLAGDNISQVPNVAAFFSNDYRSFIVSFYALNYWQTTFVPFPPIRLNHPPEYSWKVIKKHTDGTYLEELVYPLRDSLYVNGFEPFYPDKTAKFWGSAPFEIDGKQWLTKTTIRFFPSSVFIRILVWLGIIVSIYWVYNLGKKVVYK